MERTMGPALMLHTICRLVKSRGKQTAVCRLPHFILTPTRRQPLVTTLSRHNQRSPLPPIPSVEVLARLQQMYVLVLDNVASTLQG